MKTGKQLFEEFCERGKVVSNDLLMVKKEGVLRRVDIFRGSRLIAPSYNITDRSEAVLLRGLRERMGAELDARQRLATSALLRENFRDVFNYQKRLKDFEEIESSVEAAFGPVLDYAEELVLADKESGV